MFSEQTEWHIQALCLGSSCGAWLPANWPWPPGWRPAALALHQALSWLASSRLWHIWGQPVTTSVSVIAGCLPLPAEMLLVDTCSHWRP